MDFSGLIAKKRLRFEELEREVGAGSLYDNPTRARELLREHARLKELLALWNDCEKTAKELEENRAMSQGEDAEFAELAAAELPELEKKLPELQKALQIALLPPETGEDRDAIVEIRAGTGGTEAALFAADLYRMYCRYAETVGFTIEVMDTSEADLGGLKEMVFRLSGESVFRKMRYESGVHRVQRVPATEAQGRIHTSAATVAVLPEAEEVDIELKMEDLRIEVCRSGGPGGQGVNTTDSAVQILHIPTGRIVRCQDGRSQQKNKAAALQIMRSRLLEDKRREEEEKYSAHRKSLVGSGGREEKIRTYNFPQNRVTDHRIGLTLYSLDRFMEGNIGEMIEALFAADIEQRLLDAQVAALMTVLETITAATEYLQRHAVESPRLNAEHLLAHVLGKMRLDLYMAFDQPLSDAQRAPLRDLVRQRATGKPLQHLLGTAEFHGRVFLCDGRALVPRPETEQLVEFILARGTFSRALDIGTGSGVIAVTLALKMPAATVVATDISPAALELARENAAKNEAKVTFYEADLLPTGEESFDMIAANLPYIPAGEMAGLQREVKHDPALALDGGATGLEIITRLVSQAPASLRPGGLLALEIGIHQAAEVSSLLAAHNYRDIVVQPDYQGIERFVFAVYG